MLSLRHSRAVRGVFTAFVLLVLSACQVDVTVDLAVDENGGGFVSVQTAFDDDAASKLGDLTSQLRVNDAERAGWTVETAESDDGGVVVTARKAVTSRLQWQEVLDEIAGPGVFSDARVETADSFARARQSLALTMDLSDGWDLLSDEGVAAALGGERFGAPIDRLSEGRSIDEIVAVHVNATVVSDADAEAAPAASSFTHRFDSSEPLRINLRATAENSTAILMRWISFALFSLFVLATALAITGVVLQRRADRLRPPPTPASLASRVPGAAVATTVGSAAPTQQAQSGQRETVRLVVIEPLSTLYEQSKSADECLLPFVRDQGGTARADTILDGFRDLLAGSTDTESFWQLCGMDNDGSGLDEQFVARRHLRDGAGDFLQEMQERRIPVAATSNDAAIWSYKARERHRLSGVWPWLVSAEVGATTANGAMFEVLRRESGVAHRHCLYVDSDLASLDAAKELGMKTALFDTGDLDLPEIIGHPVIKDFKGLFG